MIKDEELFFKRFSAIVFNILRILCTLFLRFFIFLIDVFCE